MNTKHAPGAVAALSFGERCDIAAAHRVNPQYLYQCLSGRRQMDPLEAVRLEQATAGRVRRWHLRQADWHRIWPELVGLDGAPPVPAQVQPQPAEAA